MEGIGVNFVVIIGNEDPLIPWPSFPKSTSDGWRKVRDLKHCVIHLNKETEEKEEAQKLEKLSEN